MKFKEKIGIIFFCICSFLGKSTNSSSGEEFDELKNWITLKKGFVSSKIKISDQNFQNNQNLKIIAKDSILKDEIILSIPGSAIIFEENYELSNLIKDLKGNIQNFTTNDTIIQMINTLESLSTYYDANWFKAYMDLIPNSVIGKPLTITATDRKIMKNSYFEIFLKFLNKTNLEKFKSARKTGFSKSYNDFLKYRGLIRARSFRRSEGNNQNFLYLIPIGDLFKNDLVNFNSIWKISETHKFTLKAKEDINIGDEITVSFGNKENNMFLFIFYGFTDAKNKNSIEMVIKIILPGNQAITIKLTKSTNLPDTIKAINQYQSITASSSKEIANRIYKKVSQLLNAYSSTIEEDEIVISNKDENDNAIHIRRILKEEKEILKNYLNILQIIFEKENKK